MASEFDFRKQMEESIGQLNVMMYEWFMQAQREEQEFDEAWDKRAAEVAELKQLYNL